MEEFCSHGPFPLKSDIAFTTRLTPTFYRHALLAISVPHSIISGGAGVRSHTKEELSNYSPKVGALRVS